MPSQPRFRRACGISLISTRVFFALTPLMFTTLGPLPQAAAQTQKATAIQLPDTPQGRCAAAFLKMLQDGSDDAIKAFETQHRSAKNLAAVPMSERISRVREMRGRWGRLTPREITENAADALGLRLESENGDTIEARFEFDAVEKDKLSGIRIAASRGGGPAVRSQPLTPEQRAKVVEAAAKALEEGYVYPEIARKMADSVRGKLKTGEYDATMDEAALAQRLTDDFRAVSKDRHLRVNLLPTGNRSVLDAQPPRDWAGENYGFKKVEILPGNVGYIRFDGFINAPGAQDAAAAALAFTANCGALIFDMRHNGGGDPEMIRFITSYLFDQPTHLNDMIDRDGKIVEEFWTLKEIPGKRFAADVPVFVLTSSYTFSGAEEFSYNLKNLKRATLVGETTGGGAHPVRGVRLDDRFLIGVPFMRACNPISKTNWEGTGVTPDVSVPADDALDRALTELRSRRAATPAKP